MNDRISPQMTATPDGEAEISLVVRLPWEDVARLGQEAGRLAAQMQRPVTLDEAVSNRLRSNALGAHAKPAAAAQPAAMMPPSASVSSLPARPPAEQARQAIDRINGTA
ncbi:hypothetical protein OG223_39625 [Streptomyces sp. NBC_01478]|jgi:hypothetical protein|uniref:hypothetical protein n=1 Tax=unclassified Streptomyces TaxID=2593676 RepID=UPI002E10E259|nr:MULTISPECIES: hypothetical protein [unclassified Streptomyces]WSL06518.1 hypothetical protein OG194_10705 [Streptomyces sp. NBC_01288]